MVTILTEGSMQDNTVARLQYRLQEYRVTSPPSIKCYVLRESLSQGGIGPGPTLAWPGWKQPDIPVEVDTGRLEND